MYNRNIRAAIAASGVGGNGGKGKLANGNFGPKIGGEAGSSDASAAGTDGEEVEIVVARRLGAVSGLCANRGGKAAVAPTR